MTPPSETTEPTAATATAGEVAPDAGAAHDAAAYGSFIAAEYDEIYEGVFDTDAAVVTLGELAGGGPVVELGVGTGRLAIPLAALGIDVVGVDGSAEMLDLLAGKPGAERVRTVQGDFATVDAGGPFRLAAITFNTIFALPDQAAQVQLFRNVARHLVVGGRFVVEAWVPDLPAGSGSTLQPRRLAPGLAGLVISDHDRSRQILTTTQIVLGGSIGVRVYPVVHRYVHPAELDLMAQLAGLELEHRWSGWERGPFTATSTGHVSVYRLAGHPGSGAS